MLIDWVKKTNGSSILKISEKEENDSKFPAHVVNGFNGLFI